MASKDMMQASRISYVLDTRLCPLDTDLLACFKCTSQRKYPKRKLQLRLLLSHQQVEYRLVRTATDLEFYKGRAYRIEDVPGDDESFYAFIAYPIDLFEEGSIVNTRNWLVTYLDLKHYVIYDSKIFDSLCLHQNLWGSTGRYRVERDRLNKYGRPMLGCTIKPSSDCAKIMVERLRIFTWWS